MPASARRRERAPSAATTSEAISVRPELSLTRRPPGAGSVANTLSGVKNWTP